MNKSLIRSLIVIALVAVVLLAVTFGLQGLAVKKAQAISGVLHVRSRSAAGPKLWMAVITAAERSPAINSSPRNPVPKTG